jgi:hypothetical protein
MLAIRNSIDIHPTYLSSDLHQVPQIYSDLFDHKVLFPTSQPSLHPSTQANALRFNSNYNTICFRIFLDNNLPSCYFTESYYNSQEIISAISISRPARIDTKHCQVSHLSITSSSNKVSSFQKVIFIY